jgi:hypothetical protein
MSNVLIEGFDYVDAPGDKYTGSNLTYTSYDDVVTRSGAGQSLKMWHNTATLEIEDWITFPVQEVYFGFAFYSTSPGINGKLVDFIGNSTANGSLWLDENYRFILKDEHGTETKRSVPNAIISGVWNFIEVKFKGSSSSSAGDFSVRVNGAEVVSCDAGDDYYESANISAWTYKITIGNTTPSDQSESQYYDDIYVNSADGTKNNTFIGVCAVDVLYPNGNGYSSDFDGSDGNQVDNYLLVDDPQSTDDTDYIESNTATDKDTFTFDNSPTADTIHGLSLVCLAKKVDAGFRSIYLLCRRSSTDYRATNLISITGTSYFYTNDIMEDDPSITDAWTNTNLDAAEFGVEVYS